MQMQNQAIGNYQKMSCSGRFYGLKARFGTKNTAFMAVAVLALATALHSVQAAPLPTATIAWQQVQATRSAEGVVQAERQSTVAAQTGGRITQILFRPGDAVKQGQVIMRIDPSLAQQQVAGAQAQVAEAQVALNKAEGDYQRYQELLAKGFVSQAQMDGVASQYRAAQARVQALRAGSSQASARRRVDQSQRPRNTLSSSARSSHAMYTAYENACGRGANRPDGARLTEQSDELVLGGC